MTITVTLTDPLQLAGAQAATDAFNAATSPNADGTPATPITAQQYVQQAMERAALSWRDQYAVDRVTSGAFVLRFTQAEYDAISTAAQTDPAVAGFMQRVNESPFVWLGSAEVQQAMAYVVSLGLVTQARADEVLAY